MKKPALARYWWTVVVVASSLALSGCSRSAKKDDAGGDADRFVAEGLASFYGKGFHGRLTANGERFDRNAATAAHRKMPFGSCLFVVNTDNGRSTKVRVNDRGPYSGKRIIDVSEGAARKLGMLEKGVVRVRLYRCES